MNCICNSNNRKGLNMTKAEKIFADTYSECRMHCRHFGYQNHGYNNLITEKAYCTRTLNDIQKLIDKEAKQITLDVRLGIIPKNDYRVGAIKMVQDTLNNARQIEQRFKDLLNS